MADTRLKNFVEAFSNAFGEDREDWARAYRNERSILGQTEDAPRFEQMSATYPTAVRVRENLGLANSSAQLARDDMNMGLEKGPTRRAGQMLGTLAADVVQDKGRSFYWLLNAIQAAGGVAAEATIGKALPELFKKSPVLDSKNRPITTKNTRTALREGLIKDESEPYRTTKGIRVQDNTYMKDDYSGGMRTAAMLLPSGIAINAGVGLLTPMGGAEGYKAVFQSEEDPTKTDNVIAEIGAKYLLGKTGGLLPYDEFKQVRPDVSLSEYNQYKGYKYDNKTDLNPFDDGDVIAPMGIAKASVDGIHGPELEILGRSLPLTTGGIPFATSIAGAIAAGRSGRNRGTVARDALLGGLAGTGGGMLLGNAIEAERRRRNADDNQDTIGSGYLY